MKKVLLFLVATFFLMYCGVAQIVQKSGSKDAFGTLVDSFFTVSDTYLAVGCDANYFYTSGWLGPEIVRHDMDGSNPEVFTIPTVENIRDFTYDGTYFYAVNRTMKIFKLNLNDRTLVETIQVNCPGVTEVNFIAFDPTLDGGNGGFWLGDIHRIRTVTKNGTQLSAPFYDQNCIFIGAAYDPYSNPGNPYLWFTTQIPDGYAYIRQFDINSLSMTSFSYDLSVDHTKPDWSPAGGATSYIDKNKKFRIAANIQTSPNLILIYEMADLMPSGAPAQVENLAVTAGQNGALQAGINWINPNQTHAGTPLTELTALKIYEGNSLIHSIANPPIGEAGSYTATVTTPGYYTYTLIPENSYGTGTIATATSPWIGHDMPSAPQNPELVITDIGVGSWTVTASWTAPTTGLHGGYFTSQNLQYDVYRMPCNVLVSESQTDTTFTETITQQGTYYYTIKAKNHVGDGATCNTPERDLCASIETFPWVEAFSTTTFPPTCWKKYTAVGTANWTMGYSGFSTPYCANVWSYELGERETWLVTPMIAPTESSLFKLEFKSKVDNSTYYVFGSAEVWISTQSNDPASGTFVKVKTLVNGVDFGSTADWRTISIFLDEFVGETFYIGFKYKSTNQDNHFSWAIDDISIQEVLSVDAAANRVYGSLSPMVGEPFIYKAAVENKGAVPLSDYTVKLIDENNNVLAVSNNEPVIDLGEKAIIDFHWSPTSAGNLTLYALIEKTGDQQLSNNQSQPLPITVQDENEVFEGKIGNGTTYSFGLPFEFLTKYCMAQNIYFNHEIIDRGGSITKITYFNHFYVPSSVPIKIWMANTNLTTLDEWVHESEFTLVFEGEVTFPSGNNAVTIELDNPFSYMGNNLIIMTRPVGGVPGVMGYRQFYVTETPDFPNRGRFFMDGLNDFNWENPEMHPGTASDFHANIKITVAEEEMGALAGTVTSNGTTPIEGATVEIVGTSFQCSTDQNGNFIFPFLVPGTYQLKASKLGYEEETSDVVSVSANDTTVVNFILAPNPITTVSGKVTSVNAPNGLANVTITLKGYQTHTTTSDASGNYAFQDVYGGYVYTITAALTSYQTYTDTVEVISNTTRDIELKEICYPVSAVVAEEVGDEVVVTWSAPGSGNVTTYRYDSGTNEGQVGWANGNKNSIIGAAHRDAKTELQNISWFSTSEEGQPAYDLWILGFDTAGNPDRNNVIFRAENVQNIPNQWCTYTFPQPLFISDGFFMGVSPTYGGFTSIGTDIPNSEYPFVFNVNLSSFGPNAPWECFSLDNFYQNVMIRAEGTSFGKKEQFGYRGFERYAIYRLLEGQENDESLWSTLSPNLPEATYTDANWEGLASGVYRYAVKAVYTGGGVSVPKFSNPLRKDMSVSYTVYVTTNSGDPVTGAQLVLTNSDGDPNHVYTTQLNSGTVTFPSFWKGTYAISVMLDGFYPYSASGIEVNDGGLSYSVKLEEIINKPFSLEIQETGTVGEKLFLWDMQGASKSKVGYNVYLNDEEKATEISENEFLFTALKKGVYTAGVRSVYTSGVSEMVTIQFEVKEEGVDDLQNLNQIILYPNPFTNEIHINHPELVKTIRITDVLGSTINHIRTNPTTIKTENLSSGGGVYFVEIETFSGEKVICKMVKK